uniref:Guanylyl cyclase-activating protein 2-like n=1 Tax=Stegastes partitus TaxID=144197 RepID=A0A3B5B158_9TELE
DSNNSGFSELELSSIHDLYKFFIMECPSGSLYLHEFKRMFGVQPGTPEAQYMDNIFRAFDMNHDNTMDFIEYVAALNLVLRGKLEDKLRWSFKVFDGDDNGRLDRRELRKIVTVKITSSQSQEKTGITSVYMRQITLEEFLEGAQRSPWLQSFLQLDVNPSGWVQRYLCDRKLMHAKE